MSAKPPTPEQEQRRADDWNKKHAVGCRVRVRKDDGLFLETKTRSEAQLLGGHTAVIWLEGVSGAYALTRCMAIV